MRSDDRIAVVSTYGRPLKSLSSMNARSGFSQLPYGLIEVWPKLFKFHPYICQLRCERDKQWKRLFSRPYDILHKEREQTQKLTGNVAPNLNNFYYISLDSDANSASMANQLLQFQIVQTAYLPPIPEGAFPEHDIIPALTPLYVTNQGYLDNAASGGIDARYAWTINGGRGAGARIIDIEAGWEIGHEDLPAPSFTEGFRINRGDRLDSGPWATMVLEGRNHGTSVLGELVAADNAYGVTGIVSDAQYGIVSVLRAGQIEMEPFPFLGYVADSINIAASQLQYGDIILIEQHAPGPGDYLSCLPNCGQRYYVPMEYWQAEFEAIYDATSRGIIVVEPAGNGGQHLDNPIYNGRFDPNPKNSSGAIIVGVGDPVTHSRLAFSNYGRRVNLQGWGRDIITAGGGDHAMVNGSDQRQWYANFGGTSGASPIVAGAIAAIQGIRKAAQQSALGPEELLDYLIMTGTPQGPPVAQKIGPLPNLRETLTELDLHPPIVHGKCYHPEAHSDQCGGAACVVKPAVLIEECLFLNFFCDSYWLLYADQFECVNP